MEDKSHKYRILYVDDEDANLRVFKYTFMREYEILTALSGPEALDILKKEHVDIIVTDQRMPKMTGTELLKEVVKDHPSIIRIMLTGFSDIEALVEAVNEVGIYKYLKKPWDRDHVHGVLKEALATQKSIP